MVFGLGIRVGMKLDGGRIGGGWIGVGWRPGLIVVCHRNGKEGCRREPSDIHTYIHTYIHIYKHT